MGSNPKMSFSHVGVCVSDLERSTRFYTEALGFTLAKSIEAGAPFEVLAELPEMKLRANFLTRDGIMIELLYYDRPGSVGPAERRPMNQLGLTHMAMSVDNVDAVIERILEHGGRAYPHTRVETPVGIMAFCTDPDGGRIELWQKP
jgi:predicted enzyme related to lactoylglutathione lyase